MQIAPLKLEELNTKDFSELSEAVINILYTAECLLEEINLFFDTGEVRDVISEYGKAVNFMSMDHEDFNEYISEAITKIEEISNLLEAKFYLGQLDTLKETIETQLKGFQ